MMCAVCCGTNRGPLSITVFAATSLQPTFTDIAKRFESDNPGTSVTLHFADSADLLAQLNHGAAADVFAAGDTNTMNTAARTGLLAHVPIDFAANTLTIVVARGNPHHIHELTDLNQPGMTVTDCAPSVPCGSAAQRMQDSTGVHLHPISQESSVADVLAKVIDGQADAGLVYVTDSLAAGDAITTVAFPLSIAAANTCSIALLNDSNHAGLANRFIATVAGKTGRMIFSRAGFAKPG